MLKTQGLSRDISSPIVTGESMLLFRLLADIRAGIPIRPNTPPRIYFMRTIFLEFRNSLLPAPAAAN